MKSIEEEAKELVNKVYQPLGGLKCGVSSNEMWEYAKGIAIIHCDLMIEKLGMVLEITIDEPLIENRINHYTLLKEAVGKI